ncbi:acyltransferase [Sphingomonas sp. AR_OL41]|uniref:acyltransferase family protein n=1 Tax=Sphingomonas sp. AR_OL41 TaxID=3042729 RepID=UPI0024806129|nr:acyltransferase [Sphingomonas sp. AR_OL41]MDH7975096.1 acyltransferase [Sphingomonas sp. AR_OL41]
MTEAKPRAIIALDLLRFVSALLVVAFHYGAAFALAPSFTTAAVLHGLPVSAAATPWTWFGWIGVELFFVISGFVIALSAEGASAATFLRRRALRLLPAAWICATATLFVLGVAAPGPSLLPRWLASLMFAPNSLQIDPSYWTLGIELYFYLLIAAGLGRAGRGQTIERFGTLIGAWSAAFWLFAVMADWAATPLMDYRTAQLLLLPHGCFFALGVLAWAMLSRGVTTGRALLFGCFLAAGLTEIAGRAVERAHALGIVASSLLPMLVFSAGLIVVLASQRWQAWLSRRIDARIAATLGLMTYPLYLLHQEIGAALIAAQMRLGVPFGVAAFGALATILGAAWWVARVGEPVARNWLAAAIDAVIGLAQRPTSVRPS